MPKKSWTRLIDFCRFGSESERAAKFNYIFLTHHKNSDEIVHSKHGEPLAAVYFTYDALHRIELKSFMRQIQERVLYAYEQDEMMPGHKAEKAAQEIIESLPTGPMNVVIMDPFQVQDLKNKLTFIFESLMK